MKIIDDLKAYKGDEGIKKILATVFFNPCFHSIILYRISNFFYKIHLSIISKIVWYLNRIIYNVDIDYRADLAGGFVLIHGLGVVIGKSVKSEGKLTVYQGVTIGGNNGKIRKDENGKEWGQPLIGKNVKIYTNACVFGPVIISDNAIIKAHSIITQNI